MHPGAYSDTEVLGGGANNEYRGGPGATPYQWIRFRVGFFFFCVDYEFEVKISGFRRPGAKL